MLWKHTTIQIFRDNSIVLLRWVWSYAIGVRLMSNRDRIKRVYFKVSQSWHDIFVYYLATTATAQVVDSWGCIVRPWCLFVGQSLVIIMLPVKTLLTATFVTAGLVSDKYFIFFFLFTQTRNMLLIKIKLKILSTKGIKPTLYSTLHIMLNSSLLT